MKQPPQNGQDIPVKKPPTPTRQRKQPLLQPLPPSYPQQLPAVPEEEPVCPQQLPEVPDDEQLLHGPAPNSDPFAPRTETIRARPTRLKMWVLEREAKRRILQNVDEDSNLDISESSEEDDSDAEV